MNIIKFIDKCVYRYRCKKLYSLGHAIRDLNDDLAYSYGDVESWSIEDREKIVSSIDIMNELKKEFYRNVEKLEKQGYKAKVDLNGLMY